MEESVPRSPRLGRGSQRPDLACGCVANGSRAESRSLRRASASLRRASASKRVRGRRPTSPHPRGSPTQAERQWKKASLGAHDWEEDHNDPISPAGARGKWFKSRKPIPASSIHNDPISPAGARGKWFKSRKPIPASSIGESASSIGVQELVPWDDAISAVGSKMRELRESKEEILLLRSASALSDGAFEVLGQWSRRVALPLSGGQDGGAPMCRSATMGLDRRSGGRAPAALARGCPWQVVQEPKADACVEHRRGATI
jgi:hypothetical protein